MKLRHTDVDGQDMVLVPASKWYNTERKAEWTRSYLFQRNMIAVLGVYEAIAITTCKVPTISAVTWRLRDSKWGRAALFPLWGWLTFHLFTEGLSHP